MATAEEQLAIRHYWDARDAVEHTERHLRALVAERGPALTQTELDAAVNEYRAHRQRLLNVRPRQPWMNRHFPQIPRDVPTVAPNP